MQPQPQKTQPISKRPLYRGRAVPVGLGDLDTLPGDGIGLFCWTDARPLAGVTALLDWRLCGALTAALQREVITGAWGDVLLMPSTPRLSRRRIFLFGLGDSREWHMSMLERARSHATDVMRAAGVAHVVLGAPASRTIDDIEPSFAQVCAERSHRDLTLLVVK